VLDLAGRSDPPQRSELRLGLSFGSKEDLICRASDTSPRRLRVLGVAGASLASERVTVARTKAHTMARVDAGERM
jgi:hypothetical protein